MWDLVPQSAKATVYANQRGEFEFMWNHIAGGILRCLEIPFLRVREDALSHSDLPSEKPDSP
ncbi:hypothetical protein RDI58_001265 [Solanum bulbocastanum]|uniref:Uncharacterized protein n=1 Tax=Solanum bulbocastanum TaxID=147425 RepID=A0AAN8UE14_SOLBU